MRDGSYSHLYLGQLDNFNRSYLRKCLRAGCPSEKLNCSDLFLDRSKVLHQAKQKGNHLGLGAAVLSPYQANSGEAQNDTIRQQKRIRFLYEWDKMIKTSL